MDYLSERAARYRALSDQISDKPQEKIERDVLRNIDRVKSSGTLEAMLHDERLFGMNAIMRRTRSSED